MNTKRWVRRAMGIGLGAAATVLGCMGGGDGEMTGVAQVAITQVPTDGSVGCIAVTATGANTVTQGTDVTPGSSSVLHLHGLPTGTVKFVGNAYAGACAQVTMSSVPTWISEAVYATVGQVPVTVTLEMKPNGQATVGVDFPDASCRAVGAPCFSGAECCSSACANNACQAACAAQGAACAKNADCCSSVCNGGTCGCQSDADCASNACDAISLTCVSDQCADHRQDGAETDVDCGGGACPTCAVGQKCAVDKDCTSNACDAITLTCAASQCKDDQQDGTETDVDCGGGACAPCATGKKCNVDSDCASNACDAGAHVCDSNQCADQQKDGAETDIDCGGGTCPACAAGKHCLANTDCISGACDLVTLTCAASQCSDQQKDGNETDVDCGGGACPLCALNQKCNLDSDCASNACDVLTLTCVANQCADHRKDGNETDVDCGGGVCAACGLNQHCVLDTDCTSNACDGVSFLCVSNQCLDHRQDGTESDIDCGGTICSPCAVGKHCNSNLDCQAGHVCNASHVCQ